MVLLIDNWSPRDHKLILSRTKKRPFFKSIETGTSILLLSNSIVRESSYTRKLYSWQIGWISCNDQSGHRSGYQDCSCSGDSPVLTLDPCMESWCHIHIPQPNDDQFQATWSSDSSMVHASISNELDWSSGGLLSETQQKFKARHNPFSLTDS